MLVYSMCTQYFSVLNDIFQKNISPSGTREYRVYREGTTCRLCSNSVIKLLFSEFYFYDKDLQILLTLDISSEISTFYIISGMKDLNINNLWMFSERSVYYIISVYIVMDLYIIYLRIYYSKISKYYINSVYIFRKRY